MAKGNNKFNSKARQKKSVNIDDSSTKKIILDPDKFEKGSYDACNPLALPSKKRKVKITSIQGNEPKSKFLSRKQRKQLQQIVDRRQKKSLRAGLLDELQLVQIPSEMLDKLTPLIKIQTEGLKKLKSNASAAEANFNANAESNSDSFYPEKDKKVKPQSCNSNSIKFRSWSRRFSSMEKKEQEIKVNPKVLGFEESDEDSSDEEEFEIEQIEMGKDQISPIVLDMDVDKVEEEMICDASEESLEETPSSKSGKKPSPKNKKEQKRSQKTDKISPNTDSKASPTNSFKLPISNTPKTFVQVYRTKEIEEKRSKLPIIAEEQIIMESIGENLVTVIAGETGSGKTTQIPQFLYEAGYTLQGRMIGVTEPRRVAAISMSQRVATELNLPTSQVSYQIRYEGNASSSTLIKFMTDGVLLKEMERDFLLSKYSAICIDEAHERSLYTDILIGLLSRCVLIRLKRKDPLKLIIMSATLRIEDFVENSRLFKTPPTLIHVPARQFPVQLHFSRKTPDNYLLAAYRKILQIHKKLPPGGILVFLTGQQEVKTLVKKLSNLYANNSGQSNGSNRSGSKFKNRFLNRKKSTSGLANSSSPANSLRTFNLDNLETIPLDDEEEDFDSEEEDEELNHDWDSETLDIPATPLYVLPLYSMLSSNEQQKIFQPHPEGTRLCVISTNVAETSLTIPSIRYVVDCGKVKQKVWDKLTGVQQFRICWESKASAEQRSGRAGRLGPGHSYRLFSSAVFDSEFEKYSIPEIQLRPVDDMMLLMKSMSIHRVSNFPFPSHPGEVQLLNAERILIALGALEDEGGVLKGSPASSKEGNVKITELGKTMAHFPLGPRFSKMLALSFSTTLVPFVIALVSALSVQEVFVESSWDEVSEESKRKGKILKRKWAGSGSTFLLGDSMVLLKAVGAFEYEGGSPEFCLQSGLRPKAMLEIRKLRKQLTAEVNTLVSSGEEIPLDPQMKPPTESDATLLRQILLSGLPDRIARKATHFADSSDEKTRQDLKHAYNCGELEELVYIHSSSVLYGTNPDWIVYQEIYQSSSGLTSGSDGKMYLRGITAIEPQWIPLFCPTLCRSEQMLQHPGPYFDPQSGLIMAHQKVSYGRQGWELPVAPMEYPLRLEKYKLFAQFLFEGKIFSGLSEFQSVLLSLPITMIKPWAKLQPRTQNILKTLSQWGIHRKQDLIGKWKEDKTFLLEEYLEWIPIELQEKVRKIWPPSN